MSRKEAKAGVTRRSILTGAGLAAAGAAAAAMLPEAAQAEETPEEQVKSRYRATEHVTRFYDLNRL
jgi:hypothetical protein